MHSVIRIHPTITHSLPSAANSKNDYWREQRLLQPGKDSAWSMPLLCRWTNPKPYLLSGPQTTGGNIFYLTHPRVSYLPTRDGPYSPKPTENFQTSQYLALSYLAHGNPNKSSDLNFWLAHLLRPDHAGVFLCGPACQATPPVSRSTTLDWPSHKIIQNTSSLLLWLYCQLLSSFVLFCPAQINHRQSPQSTVTSFISWFLYLVLSLLPYCFLFPHITQPSISCLFVKFFLDIPVALPQSLGEVFILGGAQ